MVADLNNQRIADVSAAIFAASAKKTPVLLLPLGSIEDHGPNLPMGDYVTAEILAGRIAARCTAAGVETYAAPALPFGVADYFGGSPGAMAISAASFRGVLADVLDGLWRQGLSRVVILNGHGGNAPVIHEVTLAARLSRGQIVPSFYLWKIARALMERAAGNGPQYGHGAAPLLSLTQALRPNVCPAPALPEPAAGQMLGLPVAGFGTVDFEGVPVDVPAEFDAVPNTAIRAAASGDAVLGAQVVDELVATCCRFVEHFGRQAGAGRGMSDTKLFEHQRIDGAVFSDCSIAGAKFDDANLGDAVFSNVNLRGAKFSNVNMKGVTIDDADIEGLSIFGYDIQALIKAAMARDSSA
jgi:creatinine amidohydrolase